MVENYKTSFNIAHIEEESLIYGPGCRFVIWLQGCRLHCTGCWNKSMWSFDPNILLEREELLRNILLKAADGVTILGGEPLEQSDNLLWLLNQLKKSDIHIMLYTGYEMNEISSEKKYQEICNMADILIPGRYHENERDIYLKWRGSRNQKIISKDDCVIKEEDSTNEIEIIIDENGKLCCLGYPDDSISDILSYPELTSIMKE